MLSIPGVLSSFILLMTSFISSPLINSVSCSFLITFVSHSLSSVLLGFMVMRSEKKCGWFCVFVLNLSYFLFRFKIPKWFIPQGAINDNNNELIIYLSNVTNFIQETLSQVWATFT